VAASIWSGVGEVKTAPGHAASSIPRPTKAAVKRLVAAAAAGEHGHLAAHRRIRAHDVGRVKLDAQQPWMGERHALQRFLHDLFRSIDEFFHDVTLCE
jgi:hypothetical protein